MGALSVEDVLIEEVNELHGETQGERLTALLKKQEDAATGPAESRRAQMDSDIRRSDDREPGDDGRRAFYRELNKLNRAALCCSGGGIRSATFCLGVIQALAMRKPPSAAPAADAASATIAGPEAGVAPGALSVPAASAPAPSEPQNIRLGDVAEKAKDSILGHFHYLSTVSGGGYIGSWLTAWLARDDFETVWKHLTTRPAGPDIEPPEISWLRAYSSYLSPRVGLGSSDTWTGVAIFLRNLLLNWLIIIPFIALILLGLKLITVVSVALARTEVFSLHVLTLAIGVACLVKAQAFTTRNRPTRRSRDGAIGVAQREGGDRIAFLRGDLVWAALSAIFMTSFLSSYFGVQILRDLPLYMAILIGAVFGVAVFAGGWLVGKPRNREAGDFGRWAASGSVYGGLLATGSHLFTMLSPYTDSITIWTMLFPIVFGVPWVLIAQLLAEAVFVGLASYERNSDVDREWLGRCAGWIAASAIGWGLTTFVSFGLAHLLIDAKTWLGPYVASLGGIGGIAGALIGKSALTPAASRQRSGDEGFTAIALKIGMLVAGPIFAIALVVGISIALDLLLFDNALLLILKNRSLSTPYMVLWLVIAAGVTAAVAGIASRNVNINRFSLHALYRNRLVRAYLGASRQTRHPDAFTGFDGEDNPCVHTLWPPKADSDGKPSSRLFHIINITLNVVQSKRLAWQQRKAESFTVSPLHSGAAYKGYRKSTEYAGSTGISLGTAMAISGAAASPNMGYNSSPSITLLLSLFNVRLGWWLGNPGAEGDETYKREGPATAIVPLAEEAFGLTTDDRPYVYLSDGGHFENLGLYEMVRRRCRFIVAVDAGWDPDFAFEDLGNAVRKIFIDLGIRVRFDGLDAIHNRPTANKLLKDPTKELRKSIPYYAIGTIEYAKADGPGCGNGFVLYIKPAYHGTEGAGIRSYATANPTFPHESTADQFFTESQFESYRSLGLDIVNSILGGEEDEADREALRKALEGLGATTPG